MGFADIVNNGTQAINLILVASLPPVLAAAIVGVVVSLVQALTQVQEQTLGFAFKLIAVIVTLIAIMEAVSGNFLTFTRHVFSLAGRWNL